MREEDSFSKSPSPSALSLSGDMNRRVRFEEMASTR